MLHLAKVEEFESLIKSEEKILVDFYADWCGPCKMLTPVLEELEDKTGIKVLKVNVDLFMELAARYGINSIPALFLFRNGELAKKTLGYQNINQLKSFIE